MGGSEGRSGVEVLALSPSPFHVLLDPPFHPEHYKGFMNAKINNLLESTAYYPVRNTTNMSAPRHLHLHQNHHHPHSSNCPYCIVLSIRTMWELTTWHLLKQMYSSTSFRSAQRSLLIDMTSPTTKCSPLIFPSLNPPSFLSVLFSPLHFSLSNML